MCVKCGSCHSHSYIVEKAHEIFSSFAFLIHIVTISPLFLYRPVTITFTSRPNILH
uniref:Uncharacterized protein n=1 Tax=Octopus bimaculoides TaxID=37653 RepID=A0A0L8H9Q1_OCTBM